MPKSVFVAHQMLRIEQPERQADHRGDGRERDVALGEIEPDADDFRALPLCLADDAGVRNRGGIRTGARTGECEARHVLAARQPRQVMILLLLGAVVQQQFRRSQRIRHGDGRGGRCRSARLS